MIGFQLGGGVFGALAVALLAGACDQRSAAADPTPAIAATGDKPKAGDDFYAYVNGDWLAAHTLAPDEAVYGTHAELHEKAEAEIHALLEELVRSPPPPDTTAAKLADLYASLMDTAAIEARDVEPLKPLLERIADVDSIEALLCLMAVPGYASPIQIAVNPHPDDTNRSVLWVGQARLSLPNRGYYRQQDAASEEIRSAYLKHIERVMGLIGDSEPAVTAKRILDLERRIANAQSGGAENRSASTAFRVVDLSGLKRFAPAMDWDLYLGELGVANAPEIIILDGNAPRNIARLITPNSLEDWKAWMSFNLAQGMAVVLPKAFSDSSFAIYARHFGGIEQSQERWRTAISIVNGLLGAGVGELYVARAFAPERKQEVERIVGNVRIAFATRIASLDWMDQKTRDEAQAKLAALVPMLGSPDRWRSYSEVQISRANAFENVWNSHAASWKRHKNRLGKPVDREAWPYGPQTVNAAYNRLINRIVVPAAILQPPFLDPAADAAENYGAVGSIIGHEISHGFDNRGRQFDGTGARRDWWTPATAKSFLAATERLAKQYNGYCPFKGLCVNGQRTLGENIGDLTGLEIAYDAWQRSLSGAESPVIGGLTGEQRFFIAYARTLRLEMRDAALRTQLRTDRHAPNQYRVNGVVRNMDSWYAAFDVKPGDRLYLEPKDRVHVW